jgi:hypothetical protein
MAHDGTGIDWVNTNPTDSDLYENGAKEIRDLRKGVELRVMKEHQQPATTTGGGEHKKGSGRAFVLTTSPTTRPDGTTAIITSGAGDGSAGDDGRLWVNTGVTNERQLKAHDGTGWKNIRVASTAVLHERQVTGNNGGTGATASYVVRALSDSHFDADGIVTLDVGNKRFTLQTGTYEVKVVVPGYRCGRHQAVLYNVTAGAIVGVGTSAYAPDAGLDMSYTVIVCRFQITAAKVFEVRHYQEAGGSISYANGVAANFAAAGYELYTVVEITKVS